MPLRKKILKKIEQIENLNYGLYVAISLFLGAVLFVSTYLAGSETTNFVMNDGLQKTFFPNPVNSLFTVEKADGRGFDTSFKASKKYQVRYLLGTSKENLTVFSQSEGFTEEDFQQFRLNIPNKTYYFQVEVTDEQGEVLRSDIQEISNNMLK